MKTVETQLKGCYIIEPNVYTDQRGHFFESFNAKRFEEQTGLRPEFVQDNQSVSKKGVLRGLHYQQGQYAQAKLVRVIKGEVLDVVVDLRRDSATYGSHFKARLSGHNKKSLFIPKGMAHGFLALSDEVIFTYKCDALYHKAAEKGIIYNDSRLGIDWEYPTEKIVLSEKDQQLPAFKALTP